MQVKKLVESRSRSPLFLWFEENDMPNKIIQDRASGAIMGAFIGDALALGPHWYYDLAELRRDYGDWIDDYTDPKPGRYQCKGVKSALNS